MSTYQNLVDGALREVGRLASGESPTTQESTDALLILNQMLGSWSADLGMIYEETVESLAWTGNSQSMTIGASGALNTPRPQKVIESQVRVNNIDYPLQIISFQEYQQIANKPINNDYPGYLAYDPTFTNSLGTLYIWMVPASAATLRLVSLKPFTAVSALTDTVTLPPGYDETITYNLAKRFVTPFGGEASPLTLRMADSTYMALKLINIKQNGMKPDPMAPGQPTTYNPRAYWNI